MRLPHEDMRAAQRCIDQLSHHIGRLERRFGRGLETRRLRTDADHLREGLALLAMATAGKPPVPPAPEPIEIPEAPYDRRLWHDADDEGLGTRHGPGRP
ncbi:hypothetical protein [Streptomyces profundus]|uniref:hypothetical protein n=1 Tax=Streptomyces profundus TaxID=2867410 RepID=UPI003CC85341